jgi:predicted transcriptional regulator
MLKALDLMTQEVATIRGSVIVADAIKFMNFTELRALVKTRKYPKVLALRHQQLVGV